MIDLEEQFNFTNKLSHPTNPAKVVYRHYERSRAEHFTELLVDDGIDFEAQVDEEDERKPTYFGVSRSIEKKVDKLNYIALGKDRDKFIASAPVRWLVFAISAVVMFLAILGAIKAS